MTQPYKVEFDAGLHIDKAAHLLVEAAQKHGQASGEFNGIELLADRASTADEILANFDAELKRRSEAYRKSPEGRAVAVRQDAERADLQARHDGLMRRLPSLDMNNDVAVLDWLCQMQEPSDRVGVIVQRKTIVSKFEAAGYKANENCGIDYKPGNRNNMFRYLVGQALSGLKEGPAIHSIVHKFADEWRHEFGVSSEATKSDVHA